MLLGLKGVFGLGEFCLQVFQLSVLAGRGDFEPIDHIWGNFGLLFFFQGLVVWVVGLFRRWLFLDPDHGTEFGRFFLRLVKWITFMKIFCRCVFLQLGFGLNLLELVKFDTLACLLDLNRGQLRMRLRLLDNSVRV